MATQTTGRGCGTRGRSAAKDAVHSPSDGTYGVRTEGGGKGEKIQSESTIYKRTGYYCMQSVIKLVFCNVCFLKVFLGDVHQCSCSLYRKERELCTHILWSVPLSLNANGLEKCYYMQVVGVALLGYD